MLTHFGASMEPLGPPVGLEGAWCLDREVFIDLRRAPKLLVRMRIWVNPNRTSMCTVLTRRSAVFDVLQSSTSCTQVNE